MPMYLPCFDEDSFWDFFKKILSSYLFRKDSTDDISETFLL